MACSIAMTIARTLCISMLLVAAFAETDIVEATTSPVDSIPEDFALEDNFLQYDLETASEATKELRLLQSEEGRSDNQCRKMAQTEKSQISSSVSSQQRMLNRLDNGRNCHKEGLTALNNAKNRKKNADAKYRTAQHNFNKANNAQVDFPKFTYNSLREGKCPQFWRSIQYTSAKRLYEKRRRERDSAKGAVNSAAKSVRDAQAAHTRAVLRCRCRVKKEQAAVWSRANKDNAANAKAWKKAHYMLCVLATGTHAGCRVPAVPRVRKPSLASGVSGARCNGVSTGGGLQAHATVTCQATIDNYMRHVMFAGKHLSVKGDKNNWTKVKTFSFPDKPGVLSVSGQEAGNCNGCKCSGLAMTCTSNNRKSPWYNWKSTQQNVKATGHSRNVGPSGFGNKLTGSTPCQTTSGFSLKGKTTGARNAMKIWAANGGKYAWFTANPYHGRKAPAPPPARRRRTPAARNFSGLQCPKENGFCVKSNGRDENAGVRKVNSVNGNTASAQASCLKTCQRTPGATGCEVIWHQGNRGCYIHTSRAISRGNGVARHACWIFSKCKKPTPARRRRTPKANPRRRRTAPARVRVQVRAKTGNLKNAQSAATETFRVQGTHGAVTIRMRPAGKNRQATASAYGSIGNFKSLRMTAGSRDGWYYDYVQVKIGNQGWKTLHPRNQWLDGTPYDSRSSYHGRKYGKTITLHRL